MAAGFNLTAQLNLKGPTNVSVIVADIKKQLGSINASVNLTVAPAATTNINKLNAALIAFNKTLTTTTTNATATANAIRNLGTAIGSINAASLPQTLNSAASATNKLAQASANSAKQLAASTTEMTEFGKQSGLAIRRFAAFSTVTGVVYGLSNAINNGIRAYIDYDKELVKLQQVTGQSAAGLKGLEDTITSLATSLGVGSAELTGISSTLAQAGLSARDTEKALKALALSSLAPSFDSMNETVEGSIALMRQFGINAGDLEKALGSVNSVAAKFAVEAADLITAIQRTGGVFATASKGVSEGTDALNEFLAVFTSIRATTRESAETIATGLRTIFTRIQRGETIQALKEYGVNLQDLDGKFVGAYKAVELLSKGLGSLDPRDLRFSKIIEELGGFRQIGKVIPLIQQFATAQDALKVAQTGQGSLTADAAKAQEALAVQISKVREEFLALFRDIGKSDSFQAIAKGALSVTSALIKAADSIKGILPVLGVMLAFKGASAAVQFGGGFLSGVRGSGGARGLGNRMGGGPGRMNSGGEVRRYSTGGLVPGSGDFDSQDARLTPGEFVMSKPAVKAIGVSNLNNMNRGGSIRRFAVGGDIQRFPNGGIAQRRVGYIDYDVIANPSNEATIKRGMEATGADGPRLYTDYLTNLAIKSRKNSDLQKLRAVYGTAGAGKTTLARGQGTDNARLRQTERFPVLLPEDIQKATEVLILNSTVSQKKLDEVYSKTDRTYTLSSTTDEERSGVRDRKVSRDITGVGLENRKPGSTSSVSTDSAVGEALLADRLGKKSVVLGRTGSGRLRRKSGDELVDVVKKKIGFTWGGFAPMTAGHESIMDAAAAMGIPPEDFIYLVGANEGIKPGKVSSYRTAVFDQDTRVLIAKAGAGARGATVLPKPRDFEVPQAFDISEKNSKRRRVLIPAKGSMTFVADKSATETEKYKEAGYGVKNIERTGVVENGENTPISGTMVRDLIMSGDLGQLQKVLSPGVYDLISNNLGRLQNRANILPSIVAEVQQVQGAKISDVDDEIKKLGIARIDNKKVQSDPEYAAKVEILEQLRSKKKKLQSSAELEPYRLLDALAKKEPDKYALQLSPSVASEAKPIRTVSKRTQKANLGGLIQKFEDGGVAEELKSMGRAGLVDLAKKRGVPYDQSILDPRKKLSPVEEAKKQGFLRALTEAGILRQAQADDTSRRAQSRNVAVVGITGDRSATEMVTPGAIDKDTKAAVRGVPVTLQTGSLPPAVARRVQALIRNRVERLVADVSKQISQAAGLSGKRSRAEIRSITSKDLEDISGSIFEKGLGAANIQYDPKDKSIDFPKGLRSELAALMGVESGVMTDVTNAATKDTAKRKLKEGQFDRGRLEARTRYGKSQFAQGGAIKKFADGGSVVIEGDSGSKPKIGQIVPKGVPKVSFTPRGYQTTLKALGLRPNKRRSETPNTQVRVKAHVSSVSLGEESGPFSYDEIVRPGLENIDKTINRRLSQSGIKKSTSSILNDKAAKDALTGYAFETFAANILNTQAQGGKAPFDFVRPSAGLSQFTKKDPLPEYLDAKATEVSPTSIVKKAVELKSQNPGENIKFVRSRFAIGGLIQKFANAGKVSRKVDVDKTVVEESPFATARGAKTDFYSLEATSGLKSFEFDNAVRFAKNAGYSLPEFKNYLAKLVKDKQSRSEIKTDKDALRQSLMSGTPTSTARQLSLAEQLKGPADAGYRPILTGAQRIASDRLAVQKATRGFADGGTVPALVSNGEAYVPPETAKEIGYPTLHKMNQADRNGMDKFSRGGISVFRGPGSGTSDSIGPIALPVGSFILREKATKALGLNSGGSVQRFATGGLPVRPDSIQSSTVSINNNAINALKNLQKVIEGLGLTSTRIASLLINSSAVSYKAAEKVAQAELDRVKSAGGSIDQIIESENALAAIRDAKNKDVGKRNTLESAFGGVAGKSSGQVQQQIVDKADMDAEQRIKEVQAQKSALAPKIETQETTKLLDNKKKEYIEKKYKDDVAKAEKNKGSSLTQAERDAIKQQANTKAASKTFSLDDEDRKKIQARVAEKTGVSDEEKKKIYERQTFNATTSLTGKSRKELEASGIGANDIRAYAQQSQMDRKTLAQMDKELLRSRREEFKTYGTIRGMAVKSASEAETLIQQELSTRRKMATTMAQAQGLSGPGRAGYTGTGFAGGVTGSLGAAFGGLGNRAAASVRQTASGIYNRGIGGNLMAAGGGIRNIGASVGGQAGFYASMGLGLIAGQGENIAGAMTSDKRSKAQLGSGIEAGVSTAAAGLGLASSVAMIPGVGPFAAAAVLAATAVTSLTEGFKAADKGVREFEQSLRTKAIEDAGEKLSKAAEELQKDPANAAARNKVVSAAREQSALIGVDNEQRLKNAQVEKAGTRSWIGWATGQKAPTLDASEMTEIAKQRAKASEQPAQAARMAIESQIESGEKFSDIAGGAEFKELAGIIAETSPEFQAAKARIEAMSDATIAATGETREGLIAKSREIEVTKLQSDAGFLAKAKTTEAAKAMDEANKAGRQLAMTFDSMAKSFEQALGRVSYELDLMEDATDSAIDALSGQAKISKTRSKDVDVLKNPDAYDEKTKQETSKRMADFIVRPNEAGLDPLEQERRQQEASSIEKLLNSDPDKVARRATGAVANVVRENAGADLDTVSTQARAQLVSDTKDLPEQVKSEIFTKFEAIKKAVEATTGLDAKGKTDLLAQKLQDELGNAASDAAKKVKEMAIGAASFKAERINKFIDSVNRAGVAQLKATEFLNKAKDIRTESDISLREATSGGKIGLGERQQIINDRVGRLTGGELDPTKISQNIEKQTAQRSALQDTVNDESKSEKDRMTAAESLKNLDVSINKNQQALEELANSTDMAAAAMDQLQNVQKMQADRLANIDQILTSTPQELQKFNESLVRVQQRAMGINPGPSRDAQKAYNMTLRQTGGNRALAMQAGQAQMAQDRAMDLKTMEQYRSTYVLNQMNQGMSEEDANKKYNQGAANVRGQMAFESGAIRIPGLAQGIMSSVDPNIDPARKQAEQAYSNANANQAIAQEQLGRLELVKADRSLLDATKALEKAFQDLPNSFNQIQKNKLEDVNINVGKKEFEGDIPPAGDMPIFASTGKYINFAPKGTDTVPAMLTPGEFVINAKATAQHLPLLKAINSGTNLVGNTAMMSRGGVVYLAAGGVARDEKESEDIAAETANEFPAEVAVDRANPNGHFGIAAIGSYMNKNPGMGFGEMIDNVFGTPGQGMRQGEPSEPAPVVPTQAPAQTSALAAATAQQPAAVQAYAQTDQRSQIAEGLQPQVSGGGQPAPVPPQTAAQINVGVAAASMPVINASGSNTAPMPITTVDPAGTTAPMTMKDLRTPSERAGVPALPAVQDINPLDSRSETKAMAEIRRIGEELDRRRLQGSSSPNNTGVSASIQPLTKDAVKQVNDALGAQAKTVEQITGGRSLAIQSGTFDPGKGTVQERRFAMANGMTVEEVKFARQQQALSRMSPEKRQKQVDKLLRDGKLLSPSQLQAESLKLSAMQQAAGETARVNSFESNLASKGEVGKKEFDASGGKMPIRSSSELAGVVTDISKQDAQTFFDRAAIAVSTPASSMKKSEDRSGPILPSSINDPADQSRYQELEAKRQKGKFSSVDPLNPEERKEWNKLYRTRELGATPTKTDNSRRLAIMGIAPQDRTPEQQEEYSRLRYQKDSSMYTQSGGKAKTISGAKPDENFDDFKSRLRSEQEARDDRRFNALTETQKEGATLSTSDQGFLDRVSPEVKARQQARTEQFNKQMTEFSNTAVSAVGQVYSSAKSAFDSAISQFMGSDKKPDTQEPTKSGENQTAKSKSVAASTEEIRQKALADQATQEATNKENQAAEAAKEAKRLEKQQQQVQANETAKAKAIETFNSEMAARNKSEIDTAKKELEELKAQDGTSGWFGKYDNTAKINDLEKKISNNFMSSDETAVLAKLTTMPTEPGQFPKDKQNPYSVIISAREGVRADEKAKADQIAKEQAQRSQETWVDTKQTGVAGGVIKTLGAIGGVTSAVGNAAVGAATVVGGAIGTVASPITGGIGYALSGSASGGPSGKYNSEGKLIGQQPIPRTFGGNRGEEDGFGAAVGASAMANLRAVGEGLYDVAALGSAAGEAVGLGYVTREVSKELGFKGDPGIFGYQNETAVTRGNIRRSNEVREGMGEGAAFVTEFAQTTANVSAQAAAALGGAEGQLLSGAGKLVSAVPGGARVVGAIEQGAEIAGKVGGAVGSGISAGVKAVPGARQFGSAVGGAVDNFVGQASMVGSEMMGTVEGAINATGRAGYRLGKSARDTIGDVSERISYKIGEPARNARIARERAAKVAEEMKAEKLKNGTQAYRLGLSTEDVLRGARLNLDNYGADVAQSATRSFIKDSRRSAMLTPDASGVSLRDKLRSNIRTSIDEAKEAYRLGGIGQDFNLAREAVREGGKAGRSQARGVAQRQTDKIVQKKLEAKFKSEIRAKYKDKFAAATSDTEKLQVQELANMELADALSSSNVGARYGRNVDMSNLIDPKTGLKYGAKPVKPPLPKPAPAKPKAPAPAMSPSPAPAMPPSPAASINPTTGSITNPPLTANQQAVVSVVARQQPTTAAAVASSFTPVSGDSLKALTGGKRILGVDGDVFSQNGKLFTQDAKTGRMIRLTEGENEFSRMGQVPLTRLSTGGLVYASGGSLVPQSSPPGKDIVDVSNIENNERLFSSYSDKFGSSSSPISDGAIVSDKVGIPQPKISPNSTRINGSIKNISAKMAQGKEVQDIKGIELSENQVAKINNLYTEAKDQTVPALDKILDKQSISKASDSISSITNNISNVVKGINQQTEIIGSIGTSGTKELLAQMSPKTISGSINNGSPQYKADGGIVYASNGTLVAAKSVGTDTVPAMLTPGEFVVNRQAAQQHMPILQAINSGAYNQGGVVKYLAEGGIVAPQYYMGGGLAGLAGGAMEAFAGMDMSAIKELASSLDGLKDTFGSLENVKSLGDSLQVAVNTMGTNISSFGEQISSIPSQVLHNVSASVTQHVTGLGDAGRDILAQATTNASIIARNETSTIERNRFISEEGQGSHPDSILGHVGGGGQATA